MIVNHQSRQVGSPALVFWVRIDDGGTSEQIARARRGGMHRPASLA